MPPVAGRADRVVARQARGNPLPHTAAGSACGADRAIWPARGTPGRTARCLNGWGT